MKEKTLEDLNRDSYESLVYIGYFMPKSQKELEHLIYSNPANITPLINARNKLVNLKWLSPIKDYAGLKNIPLKSSPKMFIEYLTACSMERVSLIGKERQFTEDELEYVKMFLDSDFFRETFFSEYFFKNCTGMHRNCVFFGDRMHVESAIRYMRLMLQAVVIQSFFLYQDFGESYIKDVETITRDYSTFDGFLRKFFSNIQDGDLSIRIAQNQKINGTLKSLGRDEQVVYYFEKIVLNGLFLVFPFDLTQKLLSILLSGDLFSLFSIYFYDMKHEMGTLFRDLRSSAIPYDPSQHANLKKLPKK